MKNFDNITKDVTETTVERKRKNESKLFSLEEEVDDEVEALLRRSQRQRSILDDILNVEDEKARMRNNIPFWHTNTWGSVRERY